MVALRIEEDHLHEVEEGNNLQLHNIMDSLTKTEEAQEELINRIPAIEMRQVPPKDAMDEFFESHFTSSPEATNSGDCCEGCQQFTALVCGVAVICMIIGLAISMLLNPVPLKPRNRVVNLTAINGKYGMVISGDYVAMVLPRGPAASENVHRGDTIVRVNGIEVKTFSHEHIIALIRMRKGDVKLAIRENRKMFEEL